PPQLDEPGRGLLARRHRVGMTTRARRRSKANAKAGARVRAGVVACVAALGLARPAAANPPLVKGTWLEITPAVVKTGAPETCIGQGIAIDPKQPSTIYWGTTPYTAEAGGLFKSTDGGSSWRRVAKVTPLFGGASDH